jgi:hypothetical protein
MKKEIKIEVPNSYKGITLRKYLELRADLKVYEDMPDAQNAAMFYHLCGLTPDILHKIDTKTYTEIRDTLYSFVNKQDFELQTCITINGVEYGFEPNLSEMEYGAYLDIGKVGELEINENWKKVMAILYRPITKKIGQLYSIKPYTGKEECEHWLDVDMEAHFGCMFFFINLSPILLNSILNSLTEKVEIPQSIKQTLLKSGEVIQQYTNWQKEMFSSLMKSPSNL